MNRPPFDAAPDAAFYFEDAARRELLGALQYALRHGDGIIKITGAAGSGKSMLCAVLAARYGQQLEPDTRVLRLAAGSLDPQHAMHAVARQLNLPPDGMRSDEVMRMLDQHLNEQRRAGKLAVLLIEEAEALPLQTMEELRLLTNLDAGPHKLLPIALVGGPALNTLLKQPKLRQLRERITMSFVLEPFAPELVPELLESRLRAAGCDKGVQFQLEAARLLAWTVEGDLRLLMALAAQALAAAAAAGEQAVAPVHVRAAIRGEPAREPKPVPVPVPEPEEEPANPASPQDITVLPALDQRMREAEPQQPVLEPESDPEFAPPLDLVGTQAPVRPTPVHTPPVHHRKPARALAIGAAALAAVSLGAGAFLLWPAHTGQPQPPQAQAPIAKPVQMALPPAQPPAASGFALPEQAATAKAGILPPGATATGAAAHAAPVAAPVAAPAAALVAPPVAAPVAASAAAGSPATMAAPALQPAPAKGLTLDVPGRPPGLLKQSLLATKTWLRDEPDNNFCVQIENFPAAEEARAEQFLAETRAAIGLSEVHSYPMLIKGEPRIAIVYGSYASAKKVQEVQARLAERWGTRPKIRTIKGIREAVAQASK